MIKFVSHPRQNPCEGCIVRVKRIERRRCARARQKASATFRVGYAGVCVLRRKGPPHGGRYVGRFAAAQWASCRKATAHFLAGRPEAPATSGQAILVCPDTPDFRRSSRALQAPGTVAVVEHSVLAVFLIMLDRVRQHATSVGRGPCAKSRWQE